MDAREDHSPEFEPCDVCGGTEANFDGFCPQCELPMDVTAAHAMRHTDLRPARVVDDERRNDREANAANAYWKR
jgi:hypothetical protein